MNSQTNKKALYNTVNHYDNLILHSHTGSVVSANGINIARGANAAQSKILGHRASAQNNQNRVHSGTNSSNQPGGAILSHLLASQYKQAQGITGHASSIMDSQHVGEGATAQSHSMGHYGNYGKAQFRVFASAEKANNATIHGK